MNNFIEYLKIHDEEIATILNDSIVATPESWNERELRMLLDYPARILLKKLYPEIFEVLIGKSGDVKYKPLNEEVSMKKQKNIFPRNKKIGFGLTSPTIVITNALGKSEEIKFNADYLWAYQPKNLDQNFTMAIMRKDKVKLLMKKNGGDQWIISPKLEDWDYYKEFNFEQIDIDKKQSNIKFEKMLYEFIIEQYNDVKKQRKINNDIQ